MTNQELYERLLELGDNDAFFVPLDPKPDETSDPGPNEVGIKTLDARPAAPQSGDR